MSAVPNRHIPRRAVAPNGATVSTRRGSRYAAIASTWTADGKPDAYLIAASGSIETARQQGRRWFRAIPGINRAPYGEGTTWWVYDLLDAEVVAFVE